MIALFLVGLLALTALIGPPAARGLAEPCSTHLRSSAQPQAQDVDDTRSAPTAASWQEPGVAPVEDGDGVGELRVSGDAADAAPVRRALHTDPATAGQPDQAGVGVPTDFDSRNVLGGDFEQFGVPPLTPGYISLAMARIQGDPGNAYARGQWVVDWGEGTHYRSAMTVFLPDGFYTHQQGAVQLTGWDTFPVLNNHMRLIIWGQDRRARLFLKADGVDSILSSAFTIPEGRWTHLVVEQRIAALDGWSRVYMDGHLVAHGDGPTSTRYPVTRMRYGLVAIDAATQTLPLLIWLRDVTLVTLPPESGRAASGQERC
jgi:hypothetical protein